MGWLALIKWILGWFRSYGGELPWTEEEDDAAAPLMATLLEEKMALTTGFRLRDRPLIETLRLLIENRDLIFEWIAQTGELVKRLLDILKPDDSGVYRARPDQVEAWAESTSVLLDMIEFLEPPE